MPPLDSKGQFSMRKFTAFLAGSTAIMSSMASAQAPDAQADVATGKISNQYICVFNGNVGQANVRAEAGRAAGAMGQVLHVYDRAIRGFAVRLPAEHASANAQMGQLKRNNAN